MQLDRRPTRQRPLVSSTTRPARLPTSACARLPHTHSCGNLGNALSFLNDKNRNIARELYDLMIENDQEVGVSLCVCLFLCVCVFVCVRACLCQIIRMCRPPPRVETTTLTLATLLHWHPQSHPQSQSHHQSHHPHSRNPLTLARTVTPPVTPTILLYGHARSHP